MKRKYLLCLFSLYVENAILHGLRHKKGIGCLAISIKQTNYGLHCRIEDNGIGRTAAAEINSNRATHRSKATKTVQPKYIHYSI